MADCTSDDCRRDQIIFLLLYVLNQMGWERAEGTTIEAFYPPFLEELKRARVEAGFLPAQPDGSYPQLRQAALTGINNWVYHLHDSTRRREGLSIRLTPREMEKQANSDVLTDEERTKVLQCATHVVRARHHLAAP